MIRVMTRKSPAGSIGPMCVGTPLTTASLQFFGDLMVTRP